VPGRAIAGIWIRRLKLRLRDLRVRVILAVRRCTNRLALGRVRRVSTSRADFLRLFGRLTTRPRTRKRAPACTVLGTERTLASRSFFAALAWAVASVATRASAAGTATRATSTLPMAAREQRDMETDPLRLTSNGGPPPPARASYGPVNACERRRSGK
jgi:hypothetical protein